MVNTSDLSDLRRLARAAGLSSAALNAALECGLFLDDDPPAVWARELRRMRRVMNDLGVNAPGAALLTRMHRDLADLQRQVRQLQEMEARELEAWDEGLWRDLMS